MSKLERRLQILIDDDRYRLLEAEAARSNASVGAVVRQAVDYWFADEHAVRVDAVARLMALPVADDPEPDWASVKADLDAGLERVR